MCGRRKWFSALWLSGSISALIALMVAGSQGFPPGQTVGSSAKFTSTPWAGQGVCVCVACTGLEGLAREWTRGDSSWLNSVPSLDKHMVYLLVVEAVGQLALAAVNSALWTGRDVRICFRALGVPLGGGLWVP